MAVRFAERSREKDGFRLVSVDVVVIPGTNVRTNEGSGFDLERLFSLMKGMVHTATTYRA